MNVGTLPSDHAEYRLQVSRYDRVSSMMLALVILLGVVVLALLIIWLTSQIFLFQAAKPVEYTELGDSDSALGGGSDLETPPEELGLESDLETPMVAEMLTAIASAVGTKAAMLDDPRFTGMSQSGGHGDGRLGGGPGTGTGISRQWEVRFAEGNTLDSYAKQLDYFGIELGVLMPGNKVIYAYHLSRARPETRTGPADAEKRYYLTWRGGDLQQADRDLLGRTGTPTKGRLILKFLPPEVEARLLALERTRAGIDADNVRKTVFGVRAEGSGYIFRVLQQSLRN